MMLSTRQKTNIRHFIYYLVNGTLNFEQIELTFEGKYYETLKKNPDYFYKTACVFINQEVKLNPTWPDTKKLGQFICSLYHNELQTEQFEEWELDFTHNKLGLSNDFKRFTQWFVEKMVAKDYSYHDYIANGASHVEQCFAIWANVVVVNNNQVTNFHYAIKRVEQYMHACYIKNFESDLEDWEYELH